jgi:hypothetical protein
MTKQQEEQRQQWKVTLNVEVDGQSMSCPVGLDLLQSIISSCSDTEANSPLFEIMAQHPAAGIRQELANKEFLPENARARLSEDTEMAVLRNLCSNGKFRRFASENLVLQLIAKDKDCAETIASWIEEFQNCDTDVLAEAFLSSTDPERRWFLVNNYSAPTKVMKRLSTDPDPGIAAEAKKRLAER